jgi:hypothetical protein
MHQIPTKFTPEYFRGKTRKFPIGFTRVFREFHCLFFRGIVQILFSHDASTVHINSVPMACSKAQPFRPTDAGSFLPQSPSAATQQD